MNRASKSKPDLSIIRRFSSRSSDIQYATSFEFNNENGNGNGNRGTMADIFQNSTVLEVKENMRIEEDVLSTTDVGPVDENKKSTWEMVMQYRVAVLWSAFSTLR